MQKLILKSLCSLALSAIMLSIAPGASAESLQLEFGQGGPKLRLRKDCDPNREDCRPPKPPQVNNDEEDDDDNDFTDGSDRPDRRAVRICTDDKALDKAERLGLRRVRIETSGRRIVEVRGRKRNGERVTIAFGRAPNCPIID